MHAELDRLLAGYTVLRTRDVEAFHAYIAGMEGQHARHVVDAGPVEIELRHASLGRIDVGLHHASVGITVEATRRRSDCFLVQFPLSGGIDLEVDGRGFSVLPGFGAVISPAQHVHRTGRPGWTLVFRTPAAHLRACLEARMGRALSHLARFAARYKAKYGESPSKTRRRVRALERTTGAELPSSMRTLATPRGRPHRPA